MRQSVIFGMFLLAALFAPAFGQPATTPATKPAETPSRVVGTVYGKAITAADIRLRGDIDTEKQFDARNSAEWQLMRRISSAFGSPVIERFKEAANVEVTDEDMQAFLELMGRQMQENRERYEKELSDVKEQLAGADEPTTGKEEKTLAKLREREASLQRMIELVQGPKPQANDLFRSMLAHRKLQQALHKEFGGRVIFQQFGSEALDARRKLYEQAEKRGDLEFFDDGVRHMFYYYFNMRHLVVDDANLDDKPDGKAPENVR